MRSPPASWSAAGSRRRACAPGPLATILCGLLALGCEGAAEVEQPLAEVISLASVAPSTWLPGTRVLVRAEAFFPGDEARLVLDGRLDTNERLRVTIPLTAEDGRSAAGEADERVFAAGEGSFTGDATLEVVRGGATLSSTLRLQLELLSHLTPQLDRVGAPAAYFGDLLPLEGSGFVLPAEGELVALFDGTFTPDAGAPFPVRDVAASAVASTRELATLVHRPSTFGLAPGSFEGTLRLENRGHLDSAGYGSEPLQLSLASLPPVVFDVSPEVAGRGQYVRFRGGGFLEDPADRVSSLVLLSGTFTPGGGAPQKLRPFELLGRSGEGELVVVLAPRGNLEAFGGEPGTFQGQASVVVTRGQEELQGPPTQLTLTIGPTVQAVYLKYLPGFTEGLRRFGLKNVERELRDRILQVCSRSYSGYSVIFVEERPDSDFAEYSVIELTGADPNGAGLFGLDNTEGKDDGNMRLDDVIGGRNAATEELGSYAFGGVFLESFLSLSPSSEEPNPLASPRFDQLFGPFLPEQGGAVVEVGELPSGRRAPAIFDAVHALGSLVGGTVVHEIGHSLGLAAVPGDPGAFHNPGNEPGLIMNPGSARSFEERAELDGQQAQWAPYDRDYLESTLPLR